jgi:hypothetical protein
VRSLTPSEIKVIKQFRYTFSANNPLCEDIKTFFEQRGHEYFDPASPNKPYEEKNEPARQVFASIFLVHLALNARELDAARAKYRSDAHNLKNVVVRVEPVLKNADFKTHLTVNVLYAPRTYCHENEDGVFPIQQPGLYIDKLPSNPWVN